MTKQDYQSELIRLISKLDSIDEQDFINIKNKLLESKNNKGYDAEGRYKVAFFDAKPYDIEAFRQLKSDQINLIHHSVSLNEHTVGLAKNCKVVCVFVNDKCDAKVVEALSKNGVELIALRCAGFNNVDLEACKKFKLDVVRVPAYSPHAVAEHAVALMLMLNRKLHKAYLRNRAGQFVLDGLVGFDMHNKTVGVMGTGKIGQCVIRILLGFGCKVLAYDPYPVSSISEEPNVRYVSLSTLLSGSDIITLHAPLTQENHHCINLKTVETMREGCMLINTSRGGLIDTKALIAGLKSRRISAAGLDVYEEEADLFFHDKSNEVIDDDVFARLISFNNVVVTSHQAFLTKEALANIAETTLANISEFMQGRKGEQLSNKVSK